MGRILPVLVCALIAFGAWLVPEAAPERLSALQAYELLDLPVGPEPAEGAEDDERPKLWEVVCSSPAARVTDDGRLQVVLHGTAHANRREGYVAPADDPLGVIQDSGVARASLVRGLRQYVAQAAADAEVLAEHPEYANLVISGAETPATNWGANFQVDLFERSQRLTFTVDEETEPVVVERQWNAPTRSSIVPPIVAVVLAILLRRPLVALILAVFSGAYLLRREDGAGLLASLGGGALDVFLEYFKTELVAEDRIYIIGFVFFMLAMVGVMTRSGGIRGLMDRVARLANGARGTQIASWLMGLVVFFDDYANTILVGSTMRPLTDRFRISREKLSFIVDSTAAPVAGLSIFSTWIAFEVSTFSGQLPAAGLSTGDGYAVFLRTIPYSFYCILMIWFVGCVVLTGRDFGPMRTAERRARATGQVLRPGGTPMVAEEATAMEAAPNVTPSAWRAVLPLLTFMGVTLLTILYTGGFFEQGADRTSIAGLTQVLYDGSGSWPLLIGSLAGFGVAALGAWLAGLREDIPKSAWTTVRAMAVGFAILYLAWMIGAVCADLSTAPFLTALVGETLDPRILPALLFVLAGCVAFATGSSWSTMSILLPLVVGLAYQLGRDTGLAETADLSGQLLMVMSIGAVLSGAIFGDHCSPISDTTVMSSIASAADHIDHVRTQVPYALLVMSTAVVTGYFPATYYGLSPWIGLGIGAVALLFFVLVFGRRTESPPAEETGG